MHLAGLDLTMTGLLSPTSRTALAQGVRLPTPRILWRRGAGLSNSGSFGYYIQAAYYSCRMIDAQESRGPSGYGRSPPPIVGIRVPPSVPPSVPLCTTLYHYV